MCGRFALAAPKAELITHFRLDEFEGESDDFPALVRVLPDIESTEVPVFLAYPEELRQSRRIAAFRDFVTEEIMAYRKRQIEEPA